MALGWRQSQSWIAGALRRLGGNGPAGSQRSGHAQKSKQPKQSTARPRSTKKTRRPDKNQRTAQKRTTSRQVKAQQTKPRESAKDSKAPKQNQKTRSEGRATGQAPAISSASRARPTGGSRLRKTTSDGSSASIHSAHRSRTKRRIAPAGNVGFSCDHGSPL